MASLANNNLQQLSRRQIPDAKLEAPSLGVPAGQSPTRLLPWLQLRLYFLTHSRVNNRALNSALRMTRLWLTLCL